MLSDERWPLNRQFHENLRLELKARIHDRFGDHEFARRVAAVRNVATDCLDAIRRESGGLEDVIVYVEPNARKKTISIGLRDRG